MQINEVHLKLLREINKDPEISQRNLSEELKMSLGKINYCLKALKSKGLIKIKNFKKSKQKIGYLYYLTPKGMTEKTNITIKFMKLKMKEFEDLKNELNSNK